MKKIIIDSNVLIGILDERDSLSAKAGLLYNEILERNLEIVILDCVVNETISVLCRRCEEQKREAFLSDLLAKLSHIVGESEITWSYDLVRKFYGSIIQMILKNNGKTNFHDALIIMAANYFSINLLASFDRDFDDALGLIRIFDSASLHKAL